MKSTESTEPTAKRQIFTIIVIVLWWFLLEALPNWFSFDDWLYGGESVYNGQIGAFFTFKSLLYFMFPGIGGTLLIAKYLGGINLKEL